MDIPSAIRLMILFFLLVLSAFFSSAETAFTTVNRVRIRTLSQEGNRLASRVQGILDDYNRMLSTILIGNNIVNIAASSLATTLALHFWGSIAVGIVTGALTLMVLLFGEITPKTWAMYNSEKIVLYYSGIVRCLMVVFTPVIYVVDAMAGGVLKILGISRDGKSSYMTERDLRTYVDVGHEDGAIETEEKEMINNVFDFSDSDAKDIMIPKIDITMVSEDVSYQKLLSVFKESMYTRIPVYREDTDNVVGIVNIKDFLFVPNKREFKVQDILRDAYYTYEYKKTADLMMEMQENAMNVTFVLNEYGACVGMITLEDLLEEIVGEIRDEYDEDEKELIQKIGEREYLVEGGMKLDDINNALNTVLVSEDYDSIGGILIEALDRLPKEGEAVVTEGGIKVLAKEIDKNRIAKVVLTLPEESLQDGEEEERTMILQKGRPKDTSVLLEKEIRCYDMLDALGVEYEQIHHEAMATIAACEEVDKILNVKICKNLFLSNRQGTDFYLVVMPGEKKFLTKELSAQLGVARLSFASEDMMQELMELTPGSVTVLGLMNDHENKVRLIIDKDVLQEEYFACHPCMNTASLKFRTEDLMKKVIPAMKHEPVIVEL